MILTYLIGRHSETYITRYSQIDYTSALLVGPSINTSTHSDRRVGGKAHYLIVFEASNTRLYTLHQCTPLPEAWSVNTDMSPRVSTRFKLWLAESACGADVHISLRRNICYAPSLWMGRKTY